MGYKIWESNLWSLLEQKGTKTGWAVAAEALCWVLGPVLGRAAREAPPDVAGACSEGVESSQKFNICQYVKLHSLNRKAWLEITLRAENCVMCP